MARSLNASWLASMRKGVVEPVYLVTIAPTTAVSFTFQSGPCDSLSYPQLIKSVTAPNRSLDVFDRRAHVGQATVELIKDDEVDDIITTYRLLGKKMSIKIGTSELAEGNFVNVMPTGVIVDDPDEPADSAGLLKLQVKDPLHILESTKITGYWYQVHPLDVIEDIIANRVGIDSSMYTAADFTPSTYTDMSHFVVGRYGIGGYDVEFGLNEPTSALEVINQLAMTVNGALVVDEEGKIRFRVFDTSTATTEDWTTNDFSNLRVITKHRDFVNRVSVTTSSLADGKAKATIDTNDTDSQSNYAWPGTSERVSARKLENDWLNGYTFLYGPPLGSAWTDSSPAGESTPGAGDGDTAVLIGSLVGAMCGTRWPGFPSGSQASDAQISSSRLMTLRIDEELVECDQATLSTTYLRYGQLYNPEDGDYDSNVVIAHTLTVRIKNRGALGTSAAAHRNSAPNTKVYDVTIARAMGESRVERFGDGGVYVIECETDMSHANVELCDFVSLTTDRFKGYGDDGLTTTTKWEVIGKQLDYFSSPPKIKWVLAWATKTGASAGTQSWASRHGSAQRAESFERATDVDAYVRKSTDNELSPSAGAGLAILIAAGEASRGASSMRQRSQATWSVAANSTTYIYADTETHGLVSIVSGSEPDMPKSHVPIATVVAGASAITSVTDTRVTTGVNGARVHDATIEPQQVIGRMPTGRVLNLNSSFSIRRTPL